MRVIRNLLYKNPNKPHKRLLGCYGTQVPAAHRSEADKEASWEKGKLALFWVLTSWWWVVQRACPNPCSPHWTIRWHRGWVSVQTSVLPTGPSGGTEGGCLSKRPLSPLDSQVAQRVGACPNARSPHWTVRWQDILRQGNSVLVV